MCCQLPKHLGIESATATGTEAKAETENQAETDAMIANETATKCETVTGVGDATETAFRTTATSSTINQRWSRVKKSCD